MSIFHSPFSIFNSLFLALWLLSSCSEVVPIWSGKKNLEENTLYFSKPIEFELQVPGNKPEVPVSLYLELAVTYYTQIGRTDLPLSFIFEKIGDAKAFPIEKDKTIQLKEKDTWRGQIDEYNSDYTLTEQVLPDVKLTPGKYKLKIYGNDSGNPKRKDDGSEKIFGVVKIAARLYEKE